MRVAFILFGLLLSLAPAVAAGPVTGRVIKVLPFLLDAQGHASVSPSLFDRDAYQMQLRQHPAQVAGVRIDVQWRAVRRADETLKVRVEARGMTADGTPVLKTFEAPVTAGLLSRWTQFRLEGAAYRAFGSLTAWRATLWNGGQLLGEQKSFLW